MRQSLTPHEARLWIELRALKSQGYHFRRQAPFRGYYLDFVCFRSRLVVEADGGGHGDDGQAEHDAVRDDVLKRAGFTTLRVWNREINKNMAGVIDTILATLSSLPPSPSRGGLAESRGGGVWVIPDSTGGSHFPTLTASPSVPPHEGEGGR